MGLNYDERMRKSSDCLGALLVLTLIIGPASGVPPDSSYRLLKKLILGGEGGWDYFDVEPGTGHVFIPRGSHILVLNRPS